MILNFSCSEKIRLDDYLRRELPSQVNDSQNISNSKIRRLIVAGAVSVNGRECRRPAFELRGQSKISVFFEEEKFFYEKQPDDIKFELSEKDVLYEDEYLICVNKPALFPTEETIVGGEKRDNLHDAVVRYLWAKNPSLRNPPYAGIMHRLDRETSGVILFTKQRSVNKPVQKMFEDHDFKKVYYALVSAENSEKKARKVKLNESFVVEKYMNRITPKSQAGKWGEVSELKGGLYSKTVFTFLEERFFEGKKCFLVEANLFTGRTHQIRFHLSSIGFPIAGDTLYGGFSSKRVMLHACKLEFKHPLSGEKLSVLADCNF
ncbi:MAG: RluA family pseudouridine synthase [Treponema sp.]|nr:RluA family pseudouridine synthase [Treponema sp.]